MKGVFHMTKAELIAKLAEIVSLTQAQTGKVLDGLLKTLTDEISTAGSVSISGLGSFTVVERPQRKGINPKTREPLVIPASRAVKFRPAKALKEALKKS
jgi:DNA-binding protein HU-beta